ncbi:MAG: restriction endonuclease subunit S, partial [Selenomonadaceae bacterium]|nr:restriction endonuclease subunit S [Selenomonadaceae bacterium]
MSRLKDLIDKLCPHGVEFKKLGELCEIGTGNSDRKNATEDGIYPFYVRSKDILKINHYEFDETAIIIPGEGGIGEIFHFVKGKYALHQRAYRIHFIKNDIDPKFAYYCLSANFKSFIMQKAVSATVTSIRKPMIEDFKIPVPPIEVQKEIVRILDKFADGQTGLIDLLKEELTLRKKQYEYYRDKLLTFDDVEFKTLGELVKSQRGVRVVKSQLSETGKYPVYQNSMIPLGYYDKFNCPSGTTFVISAGSAGEIGYCDSKIWAADDCLYFTCPKNINSRFLYYVLQYNKNYISSQVRRSSVPRLSRSVIENLKIPIPPLDEQE